MVAACSEGRRTNSLFQSGSCWNVAGSENKEKLPNSAAFHLSFFRLAAADAAAVVKNFDTPEQGMFEVRTSR